jgi:hypothetical protein
MSAGMTGTHVHRFRDNLATELLGLGASCEEVADILGNSPEICPKTLRELVNGAAVAHQMT